MSYQHLQSSKYVTCPVLGSKDTEINQTHWEHLCKTDIHVYIQRRVSPWKQKQLFYVEESAVAQSQKQSPETLSQPSQPHTAQALRVFPSPLVMELAHSPQITGPPSRIDKADSPTKWEGRKNNTLCSKKEFPCLSKQTVWVFLETWEIPSGGAAASSCIWLRHWDRLQTMPILPLMCSSDCLATGILPWVLVDNVFVFCYISTLDDLLFLLKLSQSSVHTTIITLKICYCQCQFIYLPLSLAWRLASDKEYLIFISTLQMKKVRLQITWPYS